MADFFGIPITITHRPGDFKLGRDEEGRGWMTRMKASRGIVRGLDGEGTPIKAWIGPNKTSTAAFVVHQRNRAGEHDEEKLLLGFDDPVSAAKTVLGHYPATGHPVSAIHQIPTGGLEDWISDREAWAHTAREHHGRPHLHKDPVAFLGGHRMPVEPYEPEEPGEEIAKADEPMQDGDRWITMHPNGAGTKGNAVLLRPVKGGDGQYRVVGGAGGKLNFLKVTLTKKPEDYKREALERRGAKQAAEKQRLAGMTPEARQQEKEATAAKKEAQTGAEKEFIRKVLGDDIQEGQDVDMFHDGANADPKSAKAYHRERLRQAFRTCKEAERKITLDAEARMDSGLAQVGGAITPGLAMDAILTTKDDKGPGYDRAISTRAAANGLTAEKLIAATAEWKREQGGITTDPTKPGAPTNEKATQAAIETHIATKELQQRKATAMKEAVHEALQNAGNLKGMLEARAELRQAYQQAVEAKTGRTFQPGFLVTSSEPSPEDKEALVNDLTENLLRHHVQGFLDEVEKDNPAQDGLQGAWTGKEEEGMHAARGSAAWGMIHEAGLAVFGQGIIDRDTVEALGPEASAQVLARAIRTRFKPDEQATILSAIEAQHLREQQDTLPKLTEEAQGLRQEAAQLQAEMIETPRDFAAAAEMHRTKIEALRQARTLLGGALGRFEAQAAVIAALQSTPAKKLDVGLGRVTPEKGIQMAAAMGLQPGSYTMEHIAGEAVLTIPEKGMDSLVKPVDSAAVAEREMAVAIKRGDMDEEGYLPAGFAVRPKQRYDNPLTDPPVYQRKIELPEGAQEPHLEAALKRYIGSRWADGHRSTDISADIRGAWIRDEVPSHLHGGLDSIVDKLVPMHELVKGEDGEPIQEMHDGKPVLDSTGKPIYKTKMRDPKAIEASVEALGKSYLDTNGEANLTLEGQSVDADHPDFREAVHRVLAEDPRLQAAYVAPGELTDVHQAAIRTYFYQEHHGEKGVQLAKALEGMGPEPPQFDETTGGMGLFEELGQMENPDWQRYQEKKAELTRKFFPQEGESPWGQYVRLMGGTKQAQEAIQDQMRGKFSDGFQSHYGRLTGRQLQLGTGDAAHFQQHLKATTSPEEAEKMEAERKSKQAKMQLQGSGGFKSVKVKERMTQAGQAALFNQGGSLFASDELEEPEETPKWQKPETAPGERLTLGHRLEEQLRQVMPNASEPFQNKAFRPVEVKEGMNMDGNFAAQQRGVKAITHLERMGLFYGAGSGKTSVMMGGASELVHSGKVQKIMMAVPSIVQGQFGSEAINFLDPATGIKIHARPGESFEERLQAYRDPGQHAVVVTHQGLRDDSVKMLAQHQGKTEDEIAKWAMSADPEELKAGLSAAFEAHGASFQALMIDEGHDALNRKGKPDSLLAKIIDAHGHNSRYYVGATGSPVKNDPSEAFDWLHKIDPKRYPKSAQGEFLRRFGGDGAIVRRGLKAELSRYFFAERVDPGVVAHHSDQNVPMDADQLDKISTIERASAKLRLGEDPVKWAKQLAPGKFEGRPEQEHAAIADVVRKAVGSFKEAAMNRVINIGGAKAKAAIQAVKDRVAEGKPCVVFAHNLESVEHLHREMEAQGLRVASLTGKDSSSEKVKKLASFQGDNPSADVIVLSDAAATGANLQRGKCLIHMDQPMTYKTHEQRTARIHRLKQTSDVEVINMLADHDHDRKARERVQRKQVLANIYQSKEGYLDDSGLAEDLRAIRARQAQVEEAA